MDRQSGGWTDSQEDGQTVRRMDRQSGGWTESQKDELTVGHTDIRMGRHHGDGQGVRRMN